MKNEQKKQAETHAAAADEHVAVVPPPTPLQAAIAAQLASEHPEVPLAIMQRKPKAPDKGHTKVDVIVSGEVVATYPVAFGQSRLYYDVNTTFAPMVKAVALGLHAAGKAGGKSVFKAELLRLVANSLSVAVPEVKGATAEVDWADAEEVA